jgi:tetratricopeptide (TPR) repeat protein
MMGKRREALDSLNQALKIHEELGDRVGMAACYSRIGALLGKLSKYQEAANSLVLVNRGKPQEALDSLNKALKFHEELNDRVGMARDYMNIGNVLGHLYNYQEALDSHDKALKIREELNDRVGMAACYLNKGSVLRSMGKSQEALDSRWSKLED